MIIKQTIIRPDGSIDISDVEVAENFFNFTLEPPLDELTLTQLAIAELAEARAAAQTANELALAELAELILGGEN